MQVVFRLFRNRANRAIMADGTSAGDDRVPQESWYIPYEELQVNESIGSGGFGEVWRGTWGGTDVRFVLIVVIKSYNRAGCRQESVDQPSRIERCD